MSCACGRGDFIGEDVDFLEFYFVDFAYGVEILLTGFLAGDLELGSDGFFGGLGVAGTVCLPSCFIFFTLLVLGMLSLRTSSSCLRTFSRY